MVRGRTLGSGAGSGVSSAGAGSQPPLPFATLQVKNETPGPCRRIAVQQPVPPWASLACTPPSPAPPRPPALVVSSCPHKNARVLSDAPSGSESNIVLRPRLSIDSNSSTVTRQQLPTQTAGRAVGLTAGCRGSESIMFMPIPSSHSNRLVQRLVRQTGSRSLACASSNRSSASKRFACWRAQAPATVLIPQAHSGCFAATVCCVLDSDAGLPVAPKRVGKHAHSERISATGGYVNHAPRQRLQLLPALAVRAMDSLGRRVGLVATWCSKAALPPRSSTPPGKAAAPASAP